MPPREIPLAFLLLSALVGHSYAAESCTVGRLLLNDAISPKVAVVDLDSAASLFTFSGEGMPSNAAALTETSDSMCSSINYRASSGVTKILCSGLSFESHGDHDDIVKKTPSVLPDTLTGDNPTHISVSFGQTMVFFDGTPAKGQRRRVNRTLFRLSIPSLLEQQQLPLSSNLTRWVNSMEMLALLLMTTTLYHSQILYI